MNQNTSVDPTQEAIMVYLREFAPQLLPQEMAEIAVACTSRPDLAPKLRENAVRFESQTCPIDPTVPYESEANAS